MYVLPLFRYSCKQTLGHCLTRNETSNNSPSGSPSYFIIILNIMVHVIYVLNSLQYGEPDFVFFLRVFRRIAPRLECLLWNPPFFFDPLLASQQPKHKKKATNEENTQYTGTYTGKQKTLKSHHHQASIIPMSQWIIFAVSI